jgi:hypothetical protein
MRRILGPRSEQGDGTRARTDLRTGRRRRKREKDELKKNRKKKKKKRREKVMEKVTGGRRDKGKEKKSDGSE